MPHDPCGQEVRLKTLEMILEQVSDTLIEQKEIGKSTLDKLTAIAVQGEQIKSLTARIDKAEKDIEWQYDRLRNAEASIITHNDFVEAHRKSDDERSKISAPVIAGLIVAAVVAAAVFLLTMMDRHNYTEPKKDIPAAVIPTMPKVKTREG